MLPRPRIYISASSDDNLTEEQRSVKRAIHEEMRRRNLEPSGFLEEGRLRYGWRSDEANKAMAESDGAIVLAFARWKCQGLSPGNEPGLKVSEGNHFEAGLAVAHRVPLLVVRESGTQERGILERDFYHAIVTMPRHEVTDWVRRNEKFQEELDRWLQRVTNRARKKVFIGHGHSPVWRELKEYVSETLGLPCDEFNEGTPEGLMTAERLSQMLDQAGCAFLIMTAEDEQSSGEFNPRMNVVHEAGLMQGRLGFRRAIVMQEEGCQSLSNLAGLTHILFRKGELAAKFDRVRQVLEREGLLAPTDTE